MTLVYLVYRNQLAREAMAIFATRELAEAYVEAHHRPVNKMIVVARVLWTELPPSGHFDP